MKRKTLTIRPVRLRLQRKSGYNLQEASRLKNGLPAVNCARNGRPNSHGNRFRVGHEAVDAEDATKQHRAWVMAPENAAYRARVKRELRAKNLACFCQLDAPFCHVDTLLEVANVD